MRDIYRVSVDGDLVTHFKNLVQSKMDWLINDSELSFVDFFEETASEHYVGTLTNMEDIPLLNSILEKIHQGSFISTVDSFPEPVL